MVATLLNKEKLNQEKIYLLSSQYELYNKKVETLSKTRL